MFAPDLNLTCFVSLTRVLPNLQVSGLKECGKFRTRKKLSGGLHQEKERMKPLVVSFYGSNININDQDSEKPVPINLVLSHIIPISYLNKNRQLQNK